MNTRKSGLGVQLHDVVISYGDRIVTKPIDLTVEPGEVLSVVGPSGCGKTSLLRIIAGLNRPYSGEALIGDRKVDGVPDDLGMVFQHFGLFPWKSVAANIAYPMLIKGVSRQEREARANELIHLVGLDGFERAYPHQLSGGMQQRAGLARALATNPRIMLMDEPLGALDAQTREVLQFELLNLFFVNPITTVVVTHSIEEAVLFGDRIAIIRGKPSEIVETVTVGLPKPRGRSVISSPEFVALREHVWTQVMAG